MMDGLKPTVLMVVVQLGFAGVNVLYKLAINDGMSRRIIIAYRFLFATTFMFPVAIVFERKKKPKLSWMILFQAFLCGLFGGSLAQNLYLEALALTSATFAAAMANLVPAVTFILAVSFGLERVGLRSLTGKAKVMGTLLGIGGAMLLTFYKGPKLDMWSTHVDLLKHGGGHVASPSSSSSPQQHHHRALGSLFAVGSCICFALWLIVQAKMIEKFPYPYWSTALMCLMGSIQAIIFALCMEKDWSQWKLGWNIRLLTVAYSGIVVSGLMVTLMALCVRLRGPLFVSVFNPLLLVFVALACSLLVDEKLHLGSIIGGVLIVWGLYAVLWAKSKELKKLKKQLELPCALTPSKSSSSSNNVHEVENLHTIVTSPVQTTCSSQTVEMDHQKIEEGEEEKEAEEYNNNNN
ncbi:hypothetical protein K2173_020632 [Erythroxylum novogranatense]|uniref:WAT1-related protein n=1 Tax=Erythroxylum novogranatense TaxID=1862640 RepID=A0AAV8TL79_9ROSI|nr:hypothetical protein K2173_020632 [Erythroxylum novogranatense]